MKQFRWPIFFITILFAGTAHAEIYKRVDADGRVTYSSAPLKGAKKLQLEPLPTMAPQAVPPKTSNKNSDFRVDDSTQSKRDDTRRKILEDELATEQKALEEARAKLKDAQDTPEVFKNADGKVFRNVPKYEKNVSDAQEAVRAHENNIKALQSEISHLK